MNLKTDFVTNSSSTSFIVNDTTTNSVAKKMLDIIFEGRHEYYEEYKDPGIEKFKEFANKIYSNFKDLKEDENICIPFSTNFETFIFKNKDGIIYVETCNNHDWYRKLKIKEYVDIYTNVGYSDLYEEIRRVDFINIDTKEVGGLEELLEIITKRWENKYKEIGEK